jgi:4-cresol dehydrogenase (hydroxylating) flavoprotein subunit
VTITFIVVNARSTLGLIEIFYDRDDPADRARMQATYDGLAQATLEAGYQQYRTSVWYGQHVLDGSPDLKRLLDSMKAAVDPQDVLAPGRYSIGLPRP